MYKGYKRDKIEMRGDRAEISDFPLYLNTVAGGLDRRDQTIGGFSFVVKIYAVPVIEIIGYPNILRRTQKLFYVCCTRAKDNLVVYYPSPSDEVLEGAVSLFGRDNCIDLDAE